MKGPNQTSMALHADASLPSPLPAYAELCNMTYTLTPFNRANGSTAFVPGSHKWCRRPMGAETKVDAHPNAVAVECPPGSLVCWHSNTWHGAFNRTATGLRVSVPVYLARPSVRTEEGLIGNVPQQMLDRNSARFAVLMQQGISFGYKNQADSLQGVTRTMKTMAAYYKELGVDPSESRHSLYY
jgi:ectoine hydroxylase-related dioxygenase (phytanoyl-CoA dioxygenase family)